jgi:hypothetical protein
MTRKTETGVMMMTTGRVLMGTQPVASLNRRSVAEDAIESTTTYAMSSVAEMHVAKFKIDAETGSMKSKNRVMKGTTITMVLTTTNVTRSRHQMQAISVVASRHA